MGASFLNLGKILGIPFVIESLNLDIVIKNTDFNCYNHKGSVCIYFRNNNLYLNGIFQ